MKKYLHATGSKANKTDTEVPRAVRTYRPRFGNKLNETILLVTDWTPQVTNKRLVKVQTSFMYHD